MSEALRSFFESIVLSNPHGDPDAFQVRLKSALDKLTGEIDLESVAIFECTRDHPRSSGKTLLSPIAISGGSSNLSSDFPIYISDSNLPSSMFSRSLSGALTEQIYDHVFRNLWTTVHRQQISVYSHPLPIESTSALVAAVVYPQGKADSSVFSGFPDIVQLLNEVLRYIVAARLIQHASEIRDLASKSLLLHDHEASQLIAGIDWISQSLGTAKPMEVLTDQKLVEYSHDLSSLTSQLRYVGRLAQLSFQIPHPRRNPDYNPSSLLHKWARVFRLDAAQKEICIDYIHAHSDHDTKVPVDPQLYEQAVFNLISNAVKFCYRRTRISLFSNTKTTNSKSCHVTSVINYGNAMKDKESLYALFSRGPVGSRESGLGIGLYLVQSIANAHHGSIEHIAKEISPLNVPLIEDYINRGVDTTLRAQARNELSRLKQERIYSIIVSDKGGSSAHSEISPHQLESQIRLPTWEIRALLTMPMGAKS